MLPPSMQEVDGLFVVGFEDPAALNEVPSLWSREALYREILARDKPQVVADLSGIDYISSLGIGALVGLLRRVQDQGGRLVLVCVHPYVTSVLIGIHLSTLLPIVPDLVAARAILIPTDGADDVEPSGTPSIP